MTTHTPIRRSGSHRFGLTAIVLASTTLVGLTACGSSSTASSKTDKTTVTTTKAPSTTTKSTTPKTTTPKTTTPTTAAAVDTIPDTSPADTTPDTTPVTTGDTTPDTTADTTGTSTAGTGTGTSRADAEAALKTLLLTPAEVGPTFVEDTYTPGNGTTPCGINVEGQVPSIASTGTQIDSNEPLLALIEQIKVYDTTAEAKNAFDLASTGFACGSTETVTLGDLTDVSAQLGIPSFAVNVAANGTEGVLILALEKDAIVVMQFEKKAGAADAPGTPDTMTVAQAALTKIQNALNG